MDSPILNMSIINEHKKNLGPVLMGDLIQSYIDDTNGYVQEVSHLYGTNDMDQLAEDAAKMWTLASNIGAIRVANAAKDLAVTCKSPEATTIKESIEQLKNEVSLSIGALRDFDLN